MENDVCKDCPQKELCSGPYWCEYAEYENHDKVLSCEDNEEEEEP